MTESPAIFFHHLFERSGVNLRVLKVAYQAISSKTPETYLQNVLSWAVAEALLENGAGLLKIFELAHARMTTPTLIEALRKVYPQLVTDMRKHDPAKFDDMCRSTRVSSCGSFARGEEAPGVSTCSAKPATTKHNTVRDLVNDEKNFGGVLQHLAIALNSSWRESAEKLTNAGALRVDHNLVFRQQQHKQGAFYLNHIGSLEIDRFLANLRAVGFANHADSIERQLGGLEMDEIAGNQAAFAGDMELQTWLEMNDGARLFEKLKRLGFTNLSKLALLDAQTCSEMGVQGLHRIQFMQRIASLKGNQSVVS